MLQRGCGQRGAPQIGVQDDSSGVDDRTQRIGQRLPNLALDGVRDSGESEINGGRIQSGGCNLRAQAGEDGAGSVGHGSLAVGGNDRGQIGAVQQLIDGWEFAVEVGFGSGWHRE